jgi:hypothetical protein
MRPLIWILLLAGCAASPAQEYSPNYWTDYRGAQIETTARETQAVYKSAPYSAVLAYAECSTDYALAQLTPEERAKLDAYVQHFDKPLSRAEYDTIRAKLKASGIGDFSTLDRLAGTCPDKVPLFKQHFH